MKKNPKSQCMEEVAEKISDYRKLVLSIREEFTEADPEALPGTPTAKFYDQVAKAYAGFCLGSDLEIEKNPIVYLRGIITNIKDGVKNGDFGNPPSIPDSALDDIFSAMQKTLLKDKEKRGEEDNRLFKLMDKFAITFFLQRSTGNVLANQKLCPYLEFAKSYQFSPTDSVPDGIAAEYSLEKAETRLKEGEELLKIAEPLDQKMLNEQTLSQMLRPGSKGPLDKFKNAYYDLKNATETEKKALLQEKYELTVAIRTEQTALALRADGELRKEYSPGKKGAIDDALKLCKQHTQAGNINLNT